MHVLIGHSTYTSNFQIKLIHIEVYLQTGTYQGDFYKTRVSLASQNNTPHRASLYESLPDMKSFVSN